MEGSSASSRKSGVFDSFIRKRDSINSALDESRRDIDNWFERQPQPAPLGALANLEVLLKIRRDLLAELIALDDEFMLHLIEMRTGGSHA